MQAYDQMQDKIKKVALPFLIITYNIDSIVLCIVKIKK